MAGTYDTGANDKCGPGHSNDAVSDVGGISKSKETTSAAEARNGSAVVMVEFVRICLCL